MAKLGSTNLSFVDIFIPHLYFIQIIYKNKKKKKKEKKNETQLIYIYIKLALT